MSNSIKKGLIHHWPAMPNISVQIKHSFHLHVHEIDFHSTHFFSPIALRFPGLTVNLYYNWSPLDLSLKKKSVGYQNNYTKNKRKVKNLK